ncbi:bifunctional metallophosphatase/5'-nucleotidase [Vibrio sp. RC27]
MTPHSPCSITIAHINDTHSYFEPTQVTYEALVSDEIVKAQPPQLSIGGYARIKTRVDQLKETAALAKRQFLFLHAGDCFQGTLYFSLFRGRANADLLNRLNIDAMVVGNHELDLGNSVLAEFANNIDFKLLAGNWDLTAEDNNKPVRLSNNPKVLSYCPVLQCANYMTIFCDGEKIAIFGLSHNLMGDISNPDSDTPFVDAYITAQNTIDEIQRKGINKIIVLSHLGYEGDKKLAKQCNGISLIIGGHNHVLQGDFQWLGLPYHDDYGIEINGTRIVQSGCNSIGLGHCHIDFNADGSIANFNGKNELLVGECNLNTPTQETLVNLPGVCYTKKDDDIHQHLLAKYTNQIRELEAKRIAYFPKKMRHVRVPDQQGDSEIAPLVAKSFRHTLNELGMATDFAIHNSGGVRCSIESGDITCADISGKLLPYTIPIGRYQVSGKILAQILEGAINNALNNSVTGTGEGSYPYCDGLRFDYIKENPINERIINLECNRNNKWEKVIETEYYYGSSSLYTMSGKEGYQAIHNTAKPNFISNVSMADAFISWLKISNYSVCK